MKSSIPLILLLTSLSFAQAPHDSLHGKILAGYQGWHAPSIEGTQIKWMHYGQGGRFEPGKCCIDLWPDTADLDPLSRIPTDFRHADGRVATVYSSADPRVTDRHFAWMKDYGIDGIFLQRFGVCVASKPVNLHVQKVLDNVRQSSLKFDRSWSIMYDLSGLRKGQIRTIVMEDWKRLVKDQKIRADRTYQRHNARPLVTVWGIGFNDNRDYTLAECLELIRFLKSDPESGGNSVMIGIPYYWRELKNDTLRDDLVHKIVTESDIASPWSVGRYAKPEQLARNQTDILKPDLDWLAARKIDYLPVIFPGFSWHNLMAGRGREAKTAAIGRAKGQFLWSQALALQKTGIDMAYVAMFDEIDEGTAIYKVTSDPPIGASPFATLEGLPSDHYLWLTGQIGRLLRKQIPASDAPPLPPARQEGH